MSKDFLYLVQASSDMVERHLSLETSRADLIIYTFDKKVKYPNALFKPGTVWGEGRNILIEAAKKLKHKYKYYILLDDDVEFIKGSFKDFEDEVLLAEPDVCIPAIPWYYNEILGKYRKLMPCRYLAMNLIDSGYISFSRELFFTDKLLPYHTGYYNMPVHKNSYYPSRYFWMMLFEHYDDRKLVVTKNIKYLNTNNKFEYNPHPQHFAILDKIRKEEPSFQNKMHKQLLRFKYADSKEASSYRRNQSRKVADLLKLKLSRDPSKHLLDYRMKNAINRIKLRTVYSRIGGLLLNFLILPIFIWRDIKTNIKVFSSKKNLS